LEIAGDVNVVSGVYRVNGVAIGASNQTPWTSDINAAGFTLYSVGKIGIGMTPTYLLDVSSTPIGSTVGSLMAMARLAFGDPNVDQLRFSGYRSIADANWTGVEWRIRRTVDATDMAWLGGPDSGKAAPTNRPGPKAGTCLSIGGTGFRNA
jgi:hypothetical protein